MVTFCGGDCAEDITEHLRPYLQGLKGFKTPSVDTILRVQKNLATAKQLFISDSGIEHEFNINMDMNLLMVKLMICLEK